MIVISAQLQCLADAIPLQRENLVSAKENFLEAAKLAKRYNQTWHSIHWATSRAGVKRTVREELNHIAFDCYSYFLLGIEGLNSYADLMDAEKSPVPNWWESILSQVEDVYQHFHKNHKKEINQRQMQCVPLMIYLQLGKEKR